MNLHDDYIKLHMSKVIAFFLIFATILSFLLYFNTKNAQFGSLISGLASGFALATIQFFFSWYEYVKIDKYEKLQIINISEDRDNRQLYETLVRNAKSEIMILGSTASRLINDFADDNSNNEKNKVLLTALSKGVKVKILLPNITYLEDRQKPLFNTTNARFIEIQARYSNFEFKYFDHTPYHSIFQSDDNCIVGPMFPKVSSKNTPSIHVKASSPFAKTYLDYFRDEWR